MQDTANVTILRSATRVIVEVAPFGPRRTERNEQQFELLAEIVHEIRRRPHWDPIGEVVFPMGYFSMGAWLAKLAPQERYSALKDLDVSVVAQRAARWLQHRSPHCRLVIGIDGGVARKNVKAQRFVCVFDEHGVTPESEPSSLLLSRARTGDAVACVNNMPRWKPRRSASK